MSNFKIGQKAVCVHEDNSDKFLSGLDSSGPKEGDIVTINWISNHCLGFKEYNQNECWDDWQFRPLDESFTHETISMLNEHFESLKQTV